MSARFRVAAGACGEVAVPAPSKRSRSLKKRTPAGATWKKGDRVILPTKEGTKLPAHFMVSDCDGGLYDTRKPDWTKTPVRKQYAWACQDIQTVADLKSTLRAGPAAWPGGYEFLYVTDDGALLCTDCVKKHLRSCMDSIRNNHHDGWRIVALCTEAVSAECVKEYNEEHECEIDLNYCAHCNREFGELT
jgi:hypothetical protein